MKQIDVTVNMTLEISDEEWESFVSYEDGNPALSAAEFHLEGTDIDTPGGHAWVCSIDRAGEI